MNNSLLTAVSAIALIAATPAMAEMSAKTGVSADVKASASESDRTANQDDMPEVSKEDVKEGWNKTKQAVSDTVEDVSDATKKAYKDIKANLVSDNSADLKLTEVTIKSQTTATGIIGQPVYNGEERVGTVKDIILDQDGAAVMVVVADSDFFGLGKLAAFDYDSMVQMDASGDVMMPINENDIDRAAEFSYDQTSQSDDVRMVPSNGYSVSKLLEGELVDNQNNTVAQIDNIQFQSGEANQLIVGFDKILGLGGKTAAMSYGSASIVPDDDGYDFKLSAEKTTQFKSFKKTAVN